jgi:glycine betaine catabolism A
VYTDPDVFAWEQAHLFDSGWVCVGRADQVATARQQHAVSVGATSVLLVRGDDGVLRAFANICSHRGHELLPCGASTSRGVVQCPYHAWSYELDGSVRLAPHVGEHVDTSQFGLVSVLVAEWAGWLFVNVDGSAPSFSDHLGALPDLLANWQCDQLVVGASHQYELAANWKLACENYHECYHCPLIHPELSRVTVAASGDNYRTEAGAFVGGTMLLADHAQTMSIDGRSGGVVRPNLDPDQRRQVIYLNVFPNLLLSLHPDYVMTHRITPIAPNRTAIECQWLFAPEAVAQPDFDPSYATDLWDITNRQDWSAVESVQRGLSSPTYRPGVLAHNEDAVYQFISMFAGAYLGNGLVRGHIPAAYSR